MGGGEQGSSNNQFKLALRLHFLVFTVFLGTPGTPGRK